MSKQHAFMEQMQGLDAFLQRACIDLCINVGRLPDECSEVFKGIYGLAVNARQYDRRFIFLNDHRGGAAATYTMAHEVGHYMLGHMDQPTETQELEARMFAAVLTAMWVFNEGVQV